MSATPEEEPGRRPPIPPDAAARAIMVLPAAACVLAGLGCVVGAALLPAYDPQDSPNTEVGCHYHYYEMRSIAELKEHFPGNSDLRFPDLSRYEDDDSISLRIEYWPTEDKEVAEYYQIIVEFPLEGTTVFDDLALYFSTREEWESRGEEYPGGEPDFWVGDIPVSEKEMRFSYVGANGGITSTPAVLSLDSYYLFAVDDVVYEIYADRHFSDDVEDALEREAYVEEERTRVVELISSMARRE